MAASTSATERLTRAALGRLPAEVARPRVPLDERRVGIVHLGPGAFHRAHQAVYTEDAMAAAGDPGWGVCGITQRGRDVVARLAPQDGLYTALTVGGAGEAESARVVGSLVELLCAPDDEAAAAARIADPEVRVLTLTVTEKGYRVGGSREPPTAIDRLVAGLRLRRARGGGPLAVLSCDNLPGNGAVVRRLVEASCDGSGDAELRAWVAERVAFPSTMVDRIVPATRPADRDRVAALLGVRDEGAVVAEPFGRWVIEDHFPAGRPAWEAAGADLVADVTPHETAKLRLLNATHSALAYLGGLAGADTIDAALALPELRAFVERLTAEDMLPTLRPGPGLDPADYRTRVLRRLANPALRHTTRQVATDGTAKLPARLVAPLREQLAAGRRPRWLVLALAGWMRYVAAERDDTGAPLPLDDPRADALGEVRAAAGAPGAVVDALLRLDGVFGRDWPDAAESAELRAALTADLTALTRHGVRDALRAETGQA
ncbi:mannitol dehydrogenase family protein [Streptomyces sp. B6B3]|uniref:mannitol dehydrogenase family protein n=1 Tax=Streptomyces sp. B6B3 TaxID=3153570 RepID=UPI00325E4A24